MKALVGAYNQEKALVGAFSVIVQLHRLIDLRHYHCRHTDTFQVVMDSLDWTGIAGCNAAFQSALTSVEQVVATGGQEEWDAAAATFKLCSALDGNNLNDVRSFMELLIDNLAAIVQYNGR